MTKRLKKKVGKCSCVSCGNKIVHREAKSKGIMHCGVQCASNLLDRLRVEYALSVWDVAMGGDKG